MFSKDELKDIYYYSSKKNSGHEARLDIVTALYSIPNTFGLAWRQIKQRYQRSVLGPIWIVLGNIAFSVGFALLGQNLFKVNLEFYLLYMTAGVTAWGMVASCLIEATTAIQSEINEILSRRVSFVSIAMKTVFRNFLVLLHSLPIVIFVMFYSGRATIEALWIIPILLLVIIALVPVCLIVSIMSAKMADIGQLVSVGLQFVVYLTPVYWLESLIKSSQLKALFVDMNPFYHFVSLLRAPFLADPPSAASLVYVSLVALIAWIIADLMLQFEKRELVYWL